MQKGAGFTLVELSIVLVIIGLLTGGVLTGQSLIRASELRSITTQEQRYVTAAQTFRDKYFAIPGDMTNATAYWGSLGGTGADATCQAIAGTGGTATCNGDGSGNLGNAINQWIEGYRFWQHLGNAGLIEGSYTGYGSAWANAVAGTNVPAGRLSSTFFYAFYSIDGTTGKYIPPYLGGTIYFAYPQSNVLIFGTPGQISTAAGSYPLLPEEAYNIDTKLDDGMPGSGKVIGFKGSATVPCTTAAGLAVGSDGGATYNLTDKSKDCYVYFTSAY